MSEKEPDMGDNWLTEAFAKNRTEVQKLPDNLQRSASLPAISTRASEESEKEQEEVVKDSVATNTD